MVISWPKQTILHLITLISITLNVINNAYYPSHDLFQNISNFFDLSHPCGMTFPDLPGFFFRRENPQDGQYPGRVPGELGGMPLDFSFSAGWQA